MARLTRQDREYIDSLAQDLYSMVFHELDAEYGGEMAGRVATAAEKAFRKALEKELEIE